MAPPSPLVDPARFGRKPLEPVQSLEQSISCIHLDTSGIARRPSTPSSAASARSLRSSLRECLLSLTPPGQHEKILRSPPSSPIEARGSSPFRSSPLRESPLSYRIADTTRSNKGREQWGHHFEKAWIPHENEDGHGWRERGSQGCKDWRRPMLMDVSLGRNARARGPFRPQKANKGTSSWQLRQFAEATLGSGSLRKAVKLPEGEDVNEWLAVNVVDFYNQINLLYGSITEFCSPQSCPEMKATDEFEYLWQDSENFKRPTKMSAPEYIEHLMNWSQSNIDNESLFPSRIGVPFPKSFPNLIRQMFKRLYRVYAHIYCHHYPVVIQLGLEPHLNTSFKHYALFVHEFNLSSGKDFWGPLWDLVESMLKSD